MSTSRSFCVVCHKNKQMLKHTKPCGTKVYRNKCYSCHTSAKTKAKNNRNRIIREKPYVVFKKDSCECCGFVPIHSCQLDVDHIDGNHNNNNEDNLQTLCANCHRLKTQLNRDWFN